MFRALGILLALYASYAALTGKVYVKSGLWGKVVSREESPAYFWTVIAIYACLALTLAFVF